MRRVPYIHVVQVNVAEKTFDQGPHAGYRSLSVHCPELKRQKSMWILRLSNVEKILCSTLITFLFFFFFFKDLHSIASSRYWQGGIGSVPGNRSSIVGRASSFPIHPPSIISTPSFYRCIRNYSNAWSFRNPFDTFVPLLTND